MNLPYLFAASFILTGCALSRSELDLSEAISNDIQTAENEKTVIIDKYTDKDIYDMFNFTNQDINLIETTILKYESYSPWFQRYMCGSSSVSDEEVQNFIIKL